MNTLYTSPVVWPWPYAYAQTNLPGRRKATIDNRFDLDRPDQRGMADICPDGFSQTPFSHSLHLNIRLLKEKVLPRRIKNTRRKHHKEAKARNSFLEELFSIHTTDQLKRNNSWCASKLIDARIATGSVFKYICTYPRDNNLIYSYWHTTDPSLRFRAKIQWPDNLPRLVE